jgi:hypothetical protein
MESVEQIFKRQLEVQGGYHTRIRESLPPVHSALAGCMQAKSG